MFENLIESKPRKVRTWKQQSVSVVLHLVIGYAAITATKGAAEELTKVLQDTTNFLLATPPPPPPPEAPPPEAIVTANPPPLGFQTVMPQTEIHRDIQPVNLHELLIDDVLTGTGIAGGIATWDVRVSVACSGATCLLE